MKHPFHEQEKIDNMSWSYTLRELIENQKITGKDDLEIIVDFLRLNNLEEKGMEILYGLAQSKIEKMKYREYMIDEWIISIPSEYLYENYQIDIASNLHRLELDFIAHGKIKSKELLKWAKDNLHNIKRPQCYFNPCYDYLKTLGIMFKNDIQI